MLLPKVAEAPDTPPIATTRGAFSQSRNKPHGAASLEPHGYLGCDIRQGTARGGGTRFAPFAFRPHSSMVWTPTPATVKYGVVSCHYKARAPPVDIDLGLGAEVQILEQNGEWYRGRMMKRGAPLGIFPANHVAVFPCRLRGGPGLLEAVEVKHAQCSCPLSRAFRQQPAITVPMPRQHPPLCTALPSNRRSCVSTPPPLYFPATALNLFRQCQYAPKSNNARCN